ncbi:nitrate reductase [Pseudoalteromonas sp. SR43-6]|uniref:nitrate reductase n=1 Tax=unclassified Pseudoalteromonas TaxID=194690 RepID=UPI0015F831B3|nr:MULTISPECIES: nitrate reductase [unclassified Pseudoalteromonas]MBB1287555.1 nitrate reductase [Pseudoalteromonas sp. SR41-5]MBB1373315.1 nitrate reductase [Pseudoalteromonas sp. SR43-6]MBB1412196.1 nitrate reductase [Pseudoalteromonas sp. SG43-8]
MTTANTSPTINKTSLKQTTCAYCGVGCGVDISLFNNVPTKLEGMREHPANFGRLCVKGTHLLDTTGSDNRLTSPLINNKAATWDEATDHVANEFNDIIQKHGSDAVAFYVSGQLLTEDYYIANKLMKGYIGSGNIDTNSRLCMSSAVAGYKRAFGEDVVPCTYEDLEQTELLILIGSNAAWTHPVLYQRMERAKQLNPNMKVVVIDPRKTDTAELADTFLNIKPGSDAALYNGLLNYLNEHNHLDTQFIAQHTNGFESALQEATKWSCEAVSDFCDIAIEQVIEFYALFANSPSAISFYSMGINQSSSGVDKCNAIINAHLASGKLLKPGSGPFSITGQPNAMGGREVGGLANQLAAHLDIENEAHQSLVQRFWLSPTIAKKAGSNAIDMFDEIAAGKIKAVWIMATNPMVSLPNNAAIKKALETCELVVVSDCIAKSDTLKFANVAFPSTGWGEKNGTVTNSERRISRQRPLVAPYSGAKNDWQIMCEVAKKMGFEGFDFTDPSGIFEEWAQLTDFENNGSRLLNLSGLVGLTKSQYDNLKPIMWPVVKNQPYKNGQVFTNNQFSTADKKARFIPITPQLPVQQTSSDYPFVMNSGRIRDQWHTMSRTGKSTALSSHITRPYIEINPLDASKLAIKQNDLISAIAQTGQVTAHAKVTDAVRKGECFMPIHWNKQFASSATVSGLYQSVVDPLSGQAECKHGAVNIVKAPFEQYMQLFTKNELVINSDFWLKVNASNCFNYQLALNEAQSDLLYFCQTLTGLQGQWSAMNTAKAMHVQCIQNDQLAFVGVISNEQKEISLEWINHLFAEPLLTFTQLQSLLYATPDEEFTQGMQVCSCFKVREQPIINAIKNGANTVEQLGSELKCGTNCGSCKTQLSQLIKQHATQKANSIDVAVVM